MGHASVSDTDTDTTLMIPLNYVILLNDYRCRCVCVPVVSDLCFRAHESYYKIKDGGPNRLILILLMNLMLLKGGGLDFIESETKPKFEVEIKERNAEMIIQKEDIDENDTILPASDPPLPEDSTLINVTNESSTVIVVEENGQERQELYLEKVFEKPPTHGFYCPNCNVCIQKVYIQKIYIQPVQQPDTIRCSSCFSFLIPIGTFFEFIVMF